MDNIFARHRVDLGKYSQELATPMARHVFSRLCEEFGISEAARLKALSPSAFEHASTPPRPESLRAILMKPDRKRID
jgi:hypothetical protein